MASRNIKFNNNIWTVDESQLSEAQDTLFFQATGELLGEDYGVTIYGGEYNDHRALLDAALVSAAAAPLKTKLEALPTGNTNVVLDGKTYSFTREAISTAIATIGQGLDVASGKAPSVGLSFRSLGNGTCEVVGRGTCTDTEIRIPAVSPDGEPVVKIGESAFASRTSITSIYVPEGVSEISEYAFGEMWGLTTIYLPTTLQRIAYSAFEGCKKLQNLHISDIAAWCAVQFLEGQSEYTNWQYRAGHPFACASNDYSHHLYLNDVEITELVIPDTVTRIANNAFYNCNQITSVHVPTTLKTIGDCAFYNVPLSSEEYTYIDDKWLISLQKSYSSVFLDVDFWLKEGTVGIEDNLLYYASNTDPYERMYIPSTLLYVYPQSTVTFPVREFVVADNHPKYFAFEGNLYSRDENNNIVLEKLASNNEVYHVYKGTYRIAYNAIYSTNTNRIDLYIPKSVSQLDNAAFSIGWLNDGLYIWYEGTESEWNTLLQLNPETYIPSITSVNYNSY